MRQLLSLIAPSAVACLLLLDVQSVVRFQRAREARAGLDSALAQLPVPKDMVAVKTVYRETSFSTRGETCYYATGHVILGSTLTASEALDAYAGMLQSSGWTPRDKQYETTRIYFQGMNDLAEIYFGIPSFEIKDAVDYVELGKIYRSFIFARLVYMVPAREGC